MTNGNWLNTNTTTLHSPNVDVLDISVCTSNMYPPVTSHPSWKLWQHTDRQSNQLTKWRTDKRGHREVTTTIKCINHTLSLSLWQREYLYKITKGKMNLPLLLFYYFVLSHIWVCMIFMLISGQAVWFSMFALGHSTYMISTSVILRYNSFMSNPCLFFNFLEVS